MTEMEQRVVDLKRSELQSDLRGLGGTVVVSTQPGIAGTVVAGGFTTLVSASLTRPADGSAYAARDVISDNTIAGSASVLTFSGVARSATGSGMVLHARLVDLANQATKGQFELYLFDVKPAAQADNAAVAFGTAEVQNLVAVIPFTTPYVTNSGTVTPSCVYPGDVVNRAFVCQGTAALYGQLIINNSYTPVSGEQLVVRLAIAED